jgi:hypothetical protein
MPTRTAFLSRCVTVLEILLCFTLFVSLAAALPPGGAGGGGGFGGGHGFGGGGHFGGHSGGKSGSKPGGHFGWLHLGGRSNRGLRAGVSPYDDSSPFRSSSLWSSIAFQKSFSAPPTMLSNHAIVLAGHDGRNSFPTWRHSDNYRYHFRRYPFGRYPSSGCYFNGATQVCFFAPLVSFCGFGGAFYFDAGFGGAWSDSGDSSDDISDELGAGEMDAIAPVNDLSDYEGASGSSSTQEDTRRVNSADGKDQFILVLRNGVQYAVGDYWVADGYLEYTISNGARSQVPLESVDLEATVAKNAPRGQPFVLRTSPRL